MAFRIIKKGYMADGYTSPNVMEILVDSKDDIPNLPMECDPGSCAYTSDLTYIAQLGNDHTWAEIK